MKMGTEDLNMNLCRVLATRCSELEASQASLRAQLEEEIRRQQRWRENDDEYIYYASATGWGAPPPGNFKSPNGKLLNSLGHAVFVSHPSTALIFFWLASITEPILCMLFLTFVIVSYQTAPLKILCF